MTGAAGSGTQFTIEERSATMETSESPDVTRSHETSTLSLKMQPTGFSADKNGDLYID